MSFTINETGITTPSASEVRELALPPGVRP